MKKKRNKHGTKERPTIETDELTVVDKSKATPARQKSNSPLNIMLTVIQGSAIDFGKIFNLTQTCLRIGRSVKSNDIAVNDRKVSKIHCEISSIKTADLEQVIIKDLQSTNGTYVNGDAVHQRILTSGDKITIGETVFQFTYNDEIEEEYRSRLFNFAATDALTGLYNRRYIFNELDNQQKIARRNQRIFSLAMMDIDDFKQINDNYGHPAGDEVLKKVAFVINHTLREQDIPGRVGGEEFLIILPETGLDGAFHLADRIRERIEAAEIVYQGHTITTTISGGICQYDPAQDTDTQTLFQTADYALYQAKQSGKNCVTETLKPIGQLDETSDSPPPRRSQPGGCKQEKDKSSKPS